MLKWAKMHKELYDEFNNLKWNFNDWLYHEVQDASSTFFILYYIKPVNSTEGYKCIGTVAPKLAVTQNHPGELDKTDCPIPPKI